MPAERVQHVPMGARIDQGALVVLAVDLHQRPANIAHQRHAGRLVVDEDAGAPVGRLQAAQDEIAIIVDGILGEQHARGMIGGDVEDGRHLPLRRAVPNQRGIAARAQRQRERIEQDGLAGTGLAGQHGEAGREVDIQLLDQDDIADRQPGEHGDALLSALCSQAETPGVARMRLSRKNSAGCLIPLLRVPLLELAAEELEPVFRRHHAPFLGSRRR